MATNVSFTVRCNSKNLVAGSADSGTEQTVAQMQIVPDAYGSMSGNLGVTQATSMDTFQVGNYYDVTMVDGTAPAKEKGKKA